MLSDERWLPVVGCEAYEVSDFGRVRSVDREVTDRNGRVLRFRGRVLSPGLCTKAGYPAVMLSRPRRHCYIHRLVLEAFVGPRPQGMEALHANDRPTDNRVENLRWGTRSENTHDKISNGRANLAAFQAAGTIAAAKKRASHV